MLAPRAVWRARVVQYGRAEDPATEADRDTAAVADAAARPQSANYLWAELMQRTMGLDVLECPQCSGRLRLIAVIDDPAIIHRILRHLGLPTEIPEARPARSPPLPIGAAPAQVGADDLV